MSDFGFRGFLLLLMGWIVFVSLGRLPACPTCFGFVVAYFLRGARGSGWLRPGGFGRRRLGGLLHPDCLQLAEDFVRAEVHTVEAGFRWSGQTCLAGLRG